MGKRYVFWRKPNGRPAKNGSKYAPTEILAEYGRKSTVTTEGSVSCPTFSVNHLEAALKSIVIVIDSNNEELNDTDTWQIMWSALIYTIKKSGGKQPLKESELLKVADEKAAVFFRKQQIRYTLVSSLSLKSFPTKAVKIKGCRISPISSRRRFPCPKHIRSYPGLDAHVKSSKYILVKVFTSGQSLHVAVNCALDALNLLRGLWTLFSTYGSWTINFVNSKQKPIGIIHPGPIHTLYCRNGELADNKMFWYKPGLNEDKELFNPSEDKWKKIEEHRCWAIRKIQKLPFRQEMEELIIRYALALDQSDYNVSFLQMWSILEKLTDTVGNYDETVKRAIWPRQDQTEARELLECMRSRRNFYVHSSRGGQDTDQAIYLIKEFVDLHLVRLLVNSFNATCIKEYAEHLTLSSDVEVLRREKSLIEKAIKVLMRKNTG